MHITFHLILLFLFDKALLFGIKSANHVETALEKEEIKKSDLT